MAVPDKFLLTTWLLIAVAAWGQHNTTGVPASVRPSAYGAIAGRVLDSRGVAQTGVPITVTRQDGLLIRQVYSGPNGRFDLSRLLPGLYAIDVSLPNFLPFSKAPVAIKAGAQVVIDVNLRTLAESLEVGLPRDPAQARDDWRWALRTASPARPILRFQDEPDARQGTDATSRERPVRGTVLVSAGNESRSFGADPGLRTIFNMQYDWTGGSGMNLAGSAGWERGTPAASFRAGWSHRSDSGSASSLSATVRQLFLPSAYREQFSLPDFRFARRVQSFNGRYESEMALSANLSLRYGAAFDSMSMRRTISQWSPFGQIQYASSDQMRWTFTYTAEAPRALPVSPAASPDRVGELLAIPQISSDVMNRNHAALESGKHLEAAWERKFAGRYLLQTAAFYDSISDVAVSIAGPDGALPAGVLRDPFSNTHFLDGGNYSSSGARATFETRLSDASKLIVSYSYAGGLRAVSHTLTAENSRALREMIGEQQASVVTIAVHSVVPRSGTQVVTSYEWLPHNSVVVGDPYSSGLGRSEPFFNLALVQPLPSPDILPGQFQAIADFSNLLAQGYVPVHNSERGTSYFFPAARSFRGGFSFIF